MLRVAVIALTIISSSLALTSTSADWRDSLAHGLDSKKLHKIVSYLHINPHDYTKVVDELKDIAAYTGNDAYVKKLSSMVTDRNIFPTSSTILPWFLPLNKIIVTCFMDSDCPNTHYCSHGIWLPQCRPKICVGHCKRNEECHSGTCKACKVCQMCDTKAYLA